MTALVEAARIETLLAHTRKRGRYPAEAVHLVKEQDGLCYYCEAFLEPGFHLDHKTPLSRGGLSVLKNFAAACPPCNGRKRNRTEEEWRKILASHTLEGFIENVGMAEFNKRVNISDQTIHKILRGKAVPYRDTALRIAEGLGTDIGSIEWPKGYLHTDRRPSIYGVTRPMVLYLQGGRATDPIYSIVHATLRALGVEPQEVAEFARLMEGKAT